MASTNKTSNYELSQFLGTDKPAWLSDYNGDMSKIDAQMKLNADAATAAAGSASSAGAAVGTLSELTTDVKTSAVAAINEVDSHADTAQLTATTAANTANQANTKAGQALDGLEKFDLDTEVNLTVTSNLGNVITNTLKIRKDSTNSIYKLYGQIDVSGLGGTSGTLTLTISTNSGLNPTVAYDVDCAGLIVVTFQDGTNSLGARKFHVATDGTITIPSEVLSGSHSVISWIFSPSLYFNTSFGD